MKIFNVLIVFSETKYLERQFLKTIAILGYKIEMYLYIT